MVFRIFWLILVIQVVFQTQVEAAPRKKREASIELWPNGIIPYVIPPSQYTEEQQKTIRVAMNRWEEVTCIRFVPYTEELREQMGAKRYVEFYNGATCFSSNGLVAKQPQTIGTSSGCMSTNLIAHEIGHAIGLVHTMRRDDREHYVTVHYENMNEASWPNFETTEQTGFPYDLHNTVYDYKSIMHYKSHTWSNNGQAVLETTDPAYQDVIGRATKISFYDSLWVNRAYQCNKNCDRSRYCQNGGYIGGADCKCICPDGFIGYQCEAPLPGYQKIITWRCPDGWDFANGRCYRIYPNVYLPYSSALNFCNNQKATHVTFETAYERDWLVRTLDELKYTGNTKELWVGLKRKNDGWLGSTAHYQWLDGQEYNNTLMPLTDTTGADEDDCGYTDGQTLTIGPCIKTSYRAFICMKDFDTSCGGRFRLRGGEQYITSPGYPDAYTNSMECQYVIQARQDRRVEVSFEVFGLEITAGCADDYLRVQTGYTALDTGKKYCGQGLKNQTIISRGNLMILTFKSDMRNADVGFKATIRAVRPKYGRERSEPARFLNSFYSAFSSDNQPVERSSYLESAWDIFNSMSLSNILG